MKSTHKEHRGMNLRLRFVVLLHLARVFDHFVVLKLLLWITRQRSLEYLQRRIQGEGAGGAHPPWDDLRPFSN